MNVIILAAYILAYVTAMLRTLHSPLCAVSVERRLYSKQPSLDRYVIYFYTRIFQNLWLY
jgi:hypothetical protein